MKRILLPTVAITMLITTSCGPSAEEKAKAEEEAKVSVEQAMKDLESSFEESDNASVVDFETEEEEESLEESTSTTDWDVVLDKYDKFIDSYIKLAKKAKSGDASAMTDYPTVMQDAQELEQELSGAGNDLSPEQASRFLKLQTKFANAALELM